MRSFATLSFIATLAFSAFSAAVPTAAAHHVDGATSGLVARCDSCPPLPPVPAPCDTCEGAPINVNVKSAVVVLTELSTSISAHVDALVALTAETCKEENITPHLKEIHAALEVAVGLCTGLVGKTTAEILASVNASVVVTVALFAQLLGGIVIAIITVCAKLVVLVKGDISICGPFFAAVGAQLAALVKICIQLVPGCLTILVSVLLAIVPSIKLCAFADLLATLNLGLSL